MKIAFNQLTQQLQNKWLSCYWIASDEILLQQQALANIIQIAKQKGFEQKIVFEVNARFDWQEFIAETQNLSLFSDYTIIELRLGENKLTDNGRKILIDYLQNPAADKLILISSAKLEAATQKTQWFQTIEQSSGFIAIWPLTPAELKAWMILQFKNNQLSADNAVLQLLAEHSEGNLLAIQQAIEKLNLLYPAANIGMQEAINVISENSRFDVFALVDAALAANAKRVLKILRALQQEAQEPIIILWSLAREVRLLLKLIETSDPLTEMSLKKQGVWPKRVLLIKNAVNRGSKDFFQTLLTECAQLDAMIKGVHRGNVWDSIERLSLNLAGVKL